MKRTQIISVSDFPSDIDFEGYLWFSDQSRPLVLRGEEVPGDIFNKILPFVIEGNLWSEERKLSIKIQNVDGQYLITSFDLNHSEEDFHLDEKKYLTHRLDGIREYRVVEAWEEKQDEYMENMKTLVPSWTAFKGFIND